MNLIKRIFKIIFHYRIKLIITYKNIKKKIFHLARKKKAIKYLKIISSYNHMMILSPIKIDKK
jgi:hypothetical protein